MIWMIQSRQLRISIKLIVFKWFLVKSVFKMVLDIGLGMELSKADTTQPSRIGLGWYFEPWVD